MGAAPGESVTSLRTVGSWRVVVPQGSNSFPCHRVTGSTAPMAVTTALVVGERLVAALSAAIGSADAVEPARSPGKA